MSIDRSKPHERKIVQEIELDAPVEQVWNAIATAEGLTAWYPLEAKVEPGVGGTMSISFGGNEFASTRIVAWQPGKGLRIVGGPPGSPMPESMPDFAVWAATNPDSMGPQLLEFEIKARGGKTVLRLIHSGFLSGADWESEFWNSLDEGWPFMLGGLRHYLRYHVGRPRRVAWALKSVAVPAAEGFARLTGPGGLAFSADDLRAGKKYAVNTAAGMRLEGEIEFVKPPKLRATVANRNNSYLGVMVESCGGAMSASLWLSMFGAPQGEVDAFRDQWMVVLEKLFPEPMPS